MTETVDNKRTIKILISYVILGLLYAVPALFLYIDTHWIKDTITEASVTEYSQSLFLLVTAIVFYLTSRKSKEVHAFGIAAMALFLAMLIREQNNFLNGIHKGIWELLVLIVVIGCFLLIRHELKGFWREFSHYINSRAGGIMAVALMMLLVFSRTFGKGSIWKSVLGSGYVRTAKNMVEEGSETGAYLVILFAAFVYLNQVGKRKTSGELSD